MKIGYLIRVLESQIEISLGLSFLRKVAKYEMPGSVNQKFKKVEGMKTNWRSYNNNEKLKINSILTYSFFLYLPKHKEQHSACTQVCELNDIGSYQHSAYTLQRAKTPRVGSQPQSLESQTSPVLASEVLFQRAQGHILVCLARVSS